MIVPRPPGNQRRHRAASVGTALLLMVLMYSGLRAMAVPALGSSRAVIRRLDPLFVERYAAPAAREAPESATDREAEADAALGTVALEQEVSQAIDALALRFEGTAPGTEAGAARDAGSAVAGLQTELASSRLSELFGTDGDAAAVAAPAARAPSERPGAGSGGIALVTRGSPAPRTAAAADDTPITDVAVATTTARTGGAETTDVELKNFEADRLDRSEVDVLGEWMETHRSELPVGVRVHLNYMDAFLTAAVPVSADGRQFELYLMFNRALRELHIMLVEGDRSVYLIDRGFQAQSRSLREGTVRRVNDEIVTVNSAAGAASSDRAQEFYNIFLSWWEAAQRDVRP